MLQSEISSEPNTDEYLSAIWEGKAIAQFKEKFGTTVDPVAGAPHVDERLQVIQDGLALSDASHGSGMAGINDIDVFAIDVIWPRMLAKYTENLSPVFKDLSGFFEAIVRNNTVQNDMEEDKLVAMPWFIDNGLLFYRPSLLEKYDYSKPPETWDELVEMAKKIQTEERNSGKENFWRFVWQGMDYEGLTCNALEWQFSHNGGTIVDIDNDVDIKDSAITAFERAKKWIWDDKISPPEVIEYDEGKSLKIWLQGDAAFMRHWPYVYRASQAQDAKTRGDVGVTLLPRGNGESGRHASTLGGWQLMVNAHSKHKQKKAAIKFVEFLTSREMQKSLAIETGKLPTLIDLYDDPEVKSALEFISTDNQLKSFSENLLNHAMVKRPSISTSEKYKQISNAYAGRVHQILKDENNTTNIQAVIEGLRTDIQQLLSEQNTRDSNNQQETAKNYRELL